VAARPLVDRKPNGQLQALINETGMSNAGLARRVNACGAEHGLDLRYDKTSVSRWLRGQQPQGLTPEILAEVLGRKRGRHVSVDEIGMATGRQRKGLGAGMAFETNLSAAVDQACGLWHADVHKSDYGGGPSLGASALLRPCRRWLTEPPDPGVTRSSGLRVGTADIDMLRHVTQDFTVADHRFGSGFVRPIAVHCLDTVVSTLLRGSYTEANGRRLFAAAARLTELAGSMAVDTDRPGLAQRYFVQALRLSHAADDRPFGGYVLAGSMSRLAASAGYAREPVQLARIAQEGTRRHATPLVRAVLHASEARGYALLRDVRAYTVASEQAREALEKASPADEPVGIPFDEAYLADELAHCYLALRMPMDAAREAGLALAAHPDSRVRRRCIDLLLLATARVQAGEVEEACATAIRAVGTLPHLRSGLCNTYLRDFHALVSGYAQLPVVREFQEAVAGVDAFRVPVPRLPVPGPA
jgi:hypothetical protein